MRTTKRNELYSQGDTILKITKHLLIFKIIIRKYNGRCMN